MCSAGTTTTRSARFLAEQDEVRGQLEGQDGPAGKVDQLSRRAGRQNQQLGTVRSVADFGEISWQLTARRIEELKAEKNELETASDVCSS